MIEARYRCVGECGGEVTEDQFNRGFNTCGMKTCDKFGEPLTKFMHCTDCNGDFNEGEEHSCEV